MFSVHCSHMNEKVIYMCVVRTLDLYKHHSFRDTKVPTAHNRVIHVFTWLQRSRCPNLLADPMFSFRIFLWIYMFLASSHNIFEATLIANKFSLNQKKKIYMLTRTYWIHEYATQHDDEKRKENENRNVRRREEEKNLARTIVRWMIWGILLLLLLSIHRIYFALAPSRPALSPSTSIKSYHGSISHIRCQTLRLNVHILIIIIIMYCKRSVHSDTGIEIPLEYSRRFRALFIYEHHTLLLIYCTLYGFHISIEYTIRYTSIANRHMCTKCVHIFVWDTAQSTKYTY